MTKIFLGIDDMIDYSRDELRKVNYAYFQGKAIQLPLSPALFLPLSSGSKGKTENPSNIRTLEVGPDGEKEC